MNNPDDDIKPTIPQDLTVESLSDPEEEIPVEGDAGDKVVLEAMQDFMAERWLEEDDEDAPEREEIPLVEGEIMDAPFEHEPHITEFQIPVPWSEEQGAKTRPNFIQIIREMSIDDINTIVRAAQMVVKSWRLAGEPHRRRSYDLDIRVLFELYLELKHHFNEVYTFIEGQDKEGKVELEFLQEFKGSRNPTLLRDVYRLRPADIATLLPVLGKAIKGWSLPGSWTDAKYVLSLPAPTLKYLFEQVDAFFYNRLFKHPKP